MACEQTVAHYYAPSYERKTMRYGGHYRRDAYTCASNVFPKHAWLRVTYEGNFVIVQVTDTLPRGSKILDLSEAAFAALAPLDAGRIEVEIEVLP